MLLNILFLVATDGELRSQMIVYLIYIKSENLQEKCHISRKIDYIFFFT